MKCFTIISLLCIVSCTNFQKQGATNNEWLESAAKKSEALALDNIKSVLDTMSGEQLYFEIRKRYGKTCYPIEHISRIDLSSVGFCNIPNFYISKNEPGDINFSLDTTQTSGFMLLDKKPFAMFEIFSFKEIRFVDLIQGVDSAKWELYDSKLREGYTVFQCKMLTDLGHGQKGNTYLPYIFYKKDNGDIKVYDWPHKKDITLDIVAKKWLKK